MTRKPPTRSPAPSLRFPLEEVAAWAGRYTAKHSDTDVEALVAPVRARGHLTFDELYAVAHWKSARSAGNARRNDQAYVAEVTAMALAARTERARIEVLLCLDGVSWPTASVILHFFHADPYPILDVRALWSLRTLPPAQYQFAFWWSYVEATRELAAGAKVDMRTLDRALWMYSAARQR